jgi:hypothetical protein
MQLSLICKNNIFQPPNCPIFLGDEKGRIYDYRLGTGQNEDGHLEFRMESISKSANPSHKPKKLFMPIQLLPLLRDRMAKMLKEFDGIEEIGPTPSPLPKWVLEEEGIFKADLFSN